MAHHAEGMQHVGLLLNCHQLYHYSPISSGCSTISSDEKVVVVSNLYDGLDWYKIPDRTFSRSVPIRIAKNVIVPVQFVDGDALLITGGTSGMAKVLDARTAETIQTLDHDCRSRLIPTPAEILTNLSNAADDMIQAIVCHLAFSALHAHCFHRIFTYPRRRVKDTSQPEHRVDNQSYISGFPRLKSSQSPQQNPLLSPLPLPHKRRPGTRSGFSTVLLRLC